MISLTELAAISANAPTVPVPWAEIEEALKAQFLDVIERQWIYGLDSDE